MKYQEAFYFTAFCDTGEPSHCRNNSAPTMFSCTSQVHFLLWQNVNVYVFVLLPKSDLFVFLKYNSDLHVSCTRWTLASWSFNPTARQTWYIYKDICCIFIWILIFTCTCFKSIYFVLLCALNDSQYTTTDLKINTTFVLFHCLLTSFNLFVKTTKTKMEGSVSRIIHISAIGSNILCKAP